jgi:hypothetical protein
LWGLNQYKEQKMHHHAALFLNDTPNQSAHVRATWGSSIVYSTYLFWCVTNVAQKGIREDVFGGPKEGKEAVMTGRKNQDE